MWGPEGPLTFTEDFLDDLLKQVDRRTSCRDTWSTITRSGGLISKIEKFSDAGKTQLIMERQLSRTVGPDSVSRVTTITDIYYNADGSEDSRVVSTVTRVSQLITSCECPFSTTEDPKS